MKLSFKGKIVAFVSNANPAFPAEHWVQVSVGGMNRGGDESRYLLNDAVRSNQEFRVTIETLSTATMVQANRDARRQATEFALRRAAADFYADEPIDFTERADDILDELEKLT
jgi:hypothetical protein